MAVTVAVAAAKAAVGAVDEHILHIYSITYFPLFSFPSFHFSRCSATRRSARNTTEERTFLARHNKRSTTTRLGRGVHSEGGNISLLGFIRP